MPDTTNDDASRDPNYIAYQSLLKSDEWYSQYQGQYVAFMAGEFIGNDPDVGTLIDRLNEIYGDKSALVMKVDRNPEVIHIPLLDIL